MDWGVGGHGAFLRHGCGRPMRGGLVGGGAGGRGWAGYRTVFLMVLGKGRGILLAGLQLRGTLWLVGRRDELFRAVCVWAAALGAGGCLIATCEGAGVASCGCVLALASPWMFVRARAVLKEEIR